MQKVIIAFIFLLSAANAVAQDVVSHSNSALELLQRQAQTLRTLNFQQSFYVYYPPREPQSYLWQRGVDTSGQQMELVFKLNGNPEPKFRVNDEVIHQAQDAPPYRLQQGLLNGPLPFALLYQPSQIARSYDMMLIGKARISGREALQLRLTSKDASRYGYTVWLDAESLLLLKLDMLNLNGELLKQIQVTNTQLFNQPLASLLQYAEKVPQASLRMQQENSPAHQWRVQRLPLGMREIKRDKHRLPVVGDIVDYILLSDGMVDVSIYLRPLTSDSLAEVALSDHSESFINRHINGQVITVIGEIPLATAEQLALEVVHRQ